MLSSHLFSTLMAAALLPGAFVRSDYHQHPLNDGADWATRHLAEEHHISNFDAGAFFSLHDYDTSGTWTHDEIFRTYGLEDESLKDTPLEKRREIIHDVLDRFDRDQDGFITRTEFMDSWKEGQRLKDFGLGPGHHGDDEYEYEIHHFEKYHDESVEQTDRAADWFFIRTDTREEDLTHPEDIAHFAKHDAMEDAAERQEELDRMPIVEHNIPQKFRRVQ